MATQTGHYFSGGPVVTTARRLWDVAVVPSPPVTAGTMVVGDFAVGATLFIREAVNAVITDSDQDDFRQEQRDAIGEGHFPLAIRHSTLAIVHPSG